MHNIRWVKFGLYRRSFYEGHSLRQVDMFLDLIRQKKFHIVIDRTFPLSEARAAHRYLEGRDHFGKIVLTP